MKKFPVSLVAIVVLMVVVGGWLVRSSADDRVQLIPDTAEGDVPEVSGPLMQAKLATSQRVLEGLLNRDFDDLKSASRVLSELAEVAPTKTDELLEDRIYEHFRTEFVRLSNELEAMSNDENLEGAAYVHQNLTATCIACHSHLRDQPSE